jgi:hypothetical protein
MPLPTSPRSKPPRAYLIHTRSVMVVWHVVVEVSDVYLHVYGG